MRHIALAAWARYTRPFSSPWSLHAWCPPRPSPRVHVGSAAVPRPCAADRLPLTAPPLQPDAQQRLIVPVDGFVDVSAGDGHTCGLQWDSTVACWGSNGGGQATPPVGSLKR